MASPHYLRFVQTLALVSGVAAAGCSSNVGNNDAGDTGSTVDATSDTTIPADVSTADVQDSAMADTARVDAATDTATSDVNTADTATSDTVTNNDVVADAPVDALTTDATADVTGPMCPPVAPMDGESCPELGLNCSYLTPVGGSICDCVLAPDGSSKVWSCGMVAIGPLNPPELLAA